MRENPFSLDFGAEPSLYIPRLTEQDKIISTFSAENPSTHMFLLMGARGSGKTVLMTSVSHTMQNMDKWIHIDLNVEKDMLNTFAASIESKTKGKFPKVILSVSIKGMGVSIEKETKYSDIQTDLDEMLNILKKHDIKVLVTVDEVVNSQNVREFTTYFQHCLREKLPVFVLMTGLYKNVRALQNNRSQTFLKRTPKINIGPLNIRRIAGNYMDIFNISEQDALDISEYTSGYSYGFQILGYLLFEANKKKIDDKILFDYKLNLEECSYEKIWEELSSNEQAVAKAIADSEDCVTVKTVREKIGMDSNNFSTYQSTLENSGILEADAGYAIIKFALPFFKDFVKRQ